jgi:hypothetical protein
MVGAQTSFWLDAAFSSARPPAGVPNAATFNYGILGVRGEAQSQQWKLSAATLAGSAFSHDSGRWWWLQGDVERASTKAGFFWLDYRETFAYATRGLQLQRAFRFADDAFTVSPQVSWARWRVGDMAVDYGVIGATTQWTRVLGPALLRLSGDAFVSGNNGHASGEYFSVSSDVFAVVKGVTVGVGVTQSIDPLDTQTGFMMFASREIRDDLRLDAVFARTVTDPVFGSPGGRGLTLSGSWRFRHREAPRTKPLAEVGEAVSKGRTVKFSVQIPDSMSAKSVAVSGSFSDWRPITLRRQGELWTTTVTVEPGTHQFGFLVNGKEWYVPPSSNDVIDDGFGRKNVTLVVRPK